MAVTGDDVARFLRTDPYIPCLDFRIYDLKVTPSCYRIDVANAIASGAIPVRVGGIQSDPRSKAEYTQNYDCLDFAAGFNIALPQDQANLLHECTHASIDIQNIGDHSGHRDEAMGYLAEAIFLEARSVAPIGAGPIRSVATRIAKEILKTFEKFPENYRVPSPDADELISAIRANPLYKSKVVYASNGFKRSLWDDFLRNQ